MDEPNNLSFQNDLDLDMPCDESLNGFNDLCQEGESVRERVNPSFPCRSCVRIDSAKACPTRQPICRDRIGAHGERTVPDVEKSEFPPRSRDECAICSNAQLWPLVPKYDSLETRAFNSDGRLPRAMRRENPHVPVESYTSGSLPPEGDSTSGDNSLFDHEESGGRTGAVGVVEPLIGSYHFIRDWINRCEDTHKSCCTARSSKEHSAPALTLIDCVQRALVTPDHDLHYLALSYVWGAAADRKQGEPNRLAEAPLTVRDAMRVVHSLGYRYLWVDRYCIGQGNDEHAKLMIRNMDSVYANAIATIVALHGDDSEAGLPGVSSVKREGQQPSPPLGDLVRKAKWNGRGWTYQEGRLSRRCIFFSKQQVHFACAASVRSKEMLVAADHHLEPGGCRSSFVSGNFESHESTEGLLERGKLVPLLQSHGNPKADIMGFFSQMLHHALDVKELAYFWSDVAALSQRVFTFDGDVLDAFRGILARSSLWSLWGVPVQISGSCGTRECKNPFQRLKDPPATASSDFAYNLAWSVRSRRAEADHRRSGFPSWSWTGTLLSVFHRGMAQALSTDIKIWQVIDGHTVSLEDIMARSESKVLPESSSELLIEGLFVNTRFNVPWSTRQQPPTVVAPNPSALGEKDVLGESLLPSRGEQCSYCKERDLGTRGNELHVSSGDVQSDPTGGLLLYTESRDCRHGCTYWNILLLEHLDSDRPGRVRRLGLTSVKTTTQRARATVFTRDKMILE